MVAGLVAGWPLPAPGGEPPDPRPAGVTDERPAELQKLREENRRLREQVRSLVEQNALLHENLMNCMEELRDKEEGEQLGERRGD